LRWPTKGRSRAKSARPLESGYLEWSKAHGNVAYNLAVSGVPPCDIALLDPSLDDFTMDADNENGWPPLIERIAARYGVTTDSVALAHGTSMANFVACAALLDSGDEVVLENPVYDPLRIVPEFLNCKVRLFERPEADRYRIDIGRIEGALSRKTRLLIISNLHNPSGAQVSNEDLQAVADLAERKNFLVLVDEVYVEWLYDPARKIRSAINISPRFVTTRSLTKVYGLAALRAGWVLAEPKLAARMRRLNGLFTNSMAHPTERLAARALDRAETLLESQRARVARNYQRVQSFVEVNPRLSWVRPEAGTVGFVKLNGGSVDELVDNLLARYNTLVTPGRFFGESDHFRIGFGMNATQLEEGLQRLSQALAQK
jgi:aspartate/methionine/tyrosine aminotransferase